MSVDNLMPRSKDWVLHIEKHNLVLLSSMICVWLCAQIWLGTIQTQQPQCLNGAQHPSVVHTRHTQIFTVIKYSNMHTNWAPDAKSFQRVLERSVIITDSAGFVWLFVCITSDVARGKDTSGLKWRSSVTSAMYVPHLPVEPSALLTAPRAQTDCYLNSAGEQEIWHNQLPQWYSLWWMSWGVKYRLPFLL